MNAKIGEGSPIGRRALGTMNENGARLVNFHTEMHSWHPTSWCAVITDDYTFGNRLAVPLYLQESK